MHKEGNIMKRMQEVLLKPIIVNRNLGLGVSGVDIRLEKVIKTVRIRINQGQNGHA